MRFVLLIPILAAALQADPITVVETTSGGQASLFYSFNMPTSPGAVTAQIRGGVSCIGGIPQCGDQYATAAIDLTMDLYTDGPIRDGVALLQLTLSGGGDAAGAEHVSGGIGQYSIGLCPKELSCYLFGYFPFELGVPFAIDLSGSANANPQFFGEAGFSAFASLQLYELPTQAGDRAGAPVQINLVPEPGSAGLAFIGLSALIFFAVRRRRNLPAI
jgi:hypothetical protein